MEPKTTAVETAEEIGQAARRVLSAKAEQFTESVIREMTRLAMKHGAVNLAQGFPDFSAPAEIKEAARAAIADDINQYAITWGAKPLRDAIVEKFARTQGVTVDPEREITVCCGSTEAMMSAMMAVINPGDEVVIFEPFYENYGPDAILSGATPRFVRLHPPDLEFRPRRTGARFRPTHQGHHHQHAEQSHGQSFHARENSNSFAIFACAGMRSRSPTRFTNTSFTTERSTSRWPRSTACATAPSRSTGCPKPTASPAGASAGPLLRRRPPNRFARFTIS